MSREYVAVRSSLTRAVYLRNKGCLRNCESKRFAKIPNGAILSWCGTSSSGHAVILISNSMSRGGTFAATSVADLQQENGYETLHFWKIRDGAQKASKIQHPNRGFASYRGLQLPSRYHTASRHLVSRHAVRQIATGADGTAIGSPIDRDFTRRRPDNLVHTLKSVGPRISPSGGGL